MPRTGCHKLYSGTFLSEIVKSRVMEDHLTRYTLGSTQGKAYSWVAPLIVECKAWFEIDLFG